MKVFFASFLSQKKGSGERLGAGLLPQINAFGSSRLWRWESKRSACPAKAGDSRATIRMRVVLFWSLVVSPFHGVRVAFSSRTVPQGSQVTQKFLPLKFASLATLAALPVAVASAFFCFARPPLIPQGENRKMFLTAKKFYKNILGRQKSHPAMKPGGCTICTYCCVLMYSSNCPRMVCRRLLTALCVL